MPKTIVTLEAELEETRQRCLKAEQDGAELVERFGALVEERDTEIIRLETLLAQAEDGEGDDGTDCTKLRRSLAGYRVVLGWALWFAFVIPNQTLDAGDKRLMFLCVFFPILDYFTEKNWRRFKQRVGWRNILDNDVIRRWQARLSNQGDER